MKFFRKCAAVLLSCVMLVSFFGCGEGTSYVMTVGDYEVRAGIYIYYSINAYYDALDVLGDNGVDFASATDAKSLQKIVKGQTIDNIDIAEWIKNKATSYCIEYVAVLKKFDELELTLTAEDEDTIETYVASNMSTLGDFYKEAGIGEESVRDVVTSDVKRDAVYRAYYDEGGIEDVQESELKEYYIENNARVVYLEMQLKDGEGNLLKSDGKADMMERAEGYMDRLEDCEDEDEMLSEFDEIITEYKEYATSLSAAAVTTTDEEGNTVTTATTTKLTTTETTTTESATGDADETSSASTGTDDSETSITTTTTTTGSASSDGSDSTEETTTTTTTVVFPNETILTQMTTTEPVAAEEEESGAETTTTTEITYVPSEQCYNYIWGDDVDYGTPQLITEDEAYYIVIRLDIEDRMTEDDLWTTTNIDNVRYAIYEEPFNDLVAEWSGTYSEERNASAYKRYDPLELDLITYTSQLYSSYYGS